MYYFLDVFWLHIRCVGGWTNKLYDYFKEEQSEIGEQKSVSSQSTNRETFNPLRRRIIKSENANTPVVQESRSMNSQDTTPNSQSNKKTSISTPRVIFAPETLAEKVFKLRFHFFKWIAIWWNTNIECRLKKLNFLLIPNRLD